MNSGQNFIQPITSYQYYPLQVRFNVLICFSLLQRLCAMPTTIAARAAIHTLSSSSFLYSHYSLTYSHRTFSFHCYISKLKLHLCNTHILASIYIFAICINLATVGSNSNNPQQTTPIYLIAISSVQKIRQEIILIRSIDNNVKPNYRLGQAFNAFDFS